VGRAAAGAHGGADTRRRRSQDRSGGSGHARKRQEPIRLPALVILSRRLGLVRFEEDVLLLCAAMELDTRTAALCARAQADPARAPTFALALALFDEPV
jgi:hypothetical protein